MKHLFYYIIIILTFFSSCKGTSQKVKTEEKEYIYNYQNDTLKTDDISVFFGRVDCQLENFISPITKDEFLKDSIQYKNEYTLSDNLIENKNILELPYGNVKFKKNLKRNSDSYIDYFYIGFSKILNSHIINISLYEGNQTLLLNNTKYDYKVIDNEPIFSNNKKQILTYTDSEGLSSFLTLYTVDNNLLKFKKLLWSENSIIDYAIWSNNDEIILKLKNIENNNISYYKVLLNDKNSLLKYHLYEKFNGNFAICINDKRNDTIKSVSCYEFKIDNDKAIVDANSFVCKGEYQINFIKNDEIKLQSNNDTDCIFYIKKENNSYFIKKYNSFDWLLLKKE